MIKMMEMSHRSVLAPPRCDRPHRCDNRVVSAHYARVTAQPATAYPSVTHEYWACWEPLPGFQITPKNSCDHRTPGGVHVKSRQTDRFRNRRPSPSETQRLSPAISTKCRVQRLPRNPIFRGQPGLLLSSLNALANLRYLYRRQ